jgi:hypothetical protein
MSQQASSQHRLEAIRQIKKTLENFMISIGILSGVILILYFFTYGALVDAVGSSLIWFEVITSIMVLFVLLFLKRVCFFLTRLKLGRRYSAVFGQLILADLTLGDEALLAKMAGGDATDP